MTAAAPTSLTVWAQGGLAFLLVPPLAWLVVAYLGSLAVLLVSAFWTTNTFTGAVVHTFTTRQHRAGAHRRGVPDGDRAHRRRSHWS